MSNRYDIDARFVVAEPRPTIVDPALPQRYAESVLSVPTNAEIDGAALQQMETVSEKSTPEARARATLIKLSGALLAAAIIAYGMNRAGVAGWAAWAVFTALVIGAIAWTYRSDNEYSPLGVERYKARQYRSIRLAEIASNERVMIRKIDAYTETLNRVYGGKPDA